MSTGLQTPLLVDDRNAKQVLDPSRSIITLDLQMFKPWRGEQRSSQAAFELLGKYLIARAAICEGSVERARILYTIPDVCRAVPGFVRQDAIALSALILGWVEREGLASEIFTPSAVALGLLKGTNKAASFLRRELDRPFIKEHEKIVILYAVSHFDEKFLPLFKPVIEKCFSARTGPFGVKVEDSPDVQRAALAVIEKLGANAAEFTPLLLEKLRQEAAPPKPDVLTPQEVHPEIVGFLCTTLLSIVGGKGDLIADDLFSVLRAAANGTKVGATWNQEMVDVLQLVSYKMVEMGVDFGEPAKAPLRSVYDFVLNASDHRNLPRELVDVSNAMLRKLEPSTAQAS